MVWFKVSNSECSPSHKKVLKFSEDETRHGVCPYADQHRNLVQIKFSFVLLSNLFHVIVRDVQAS